MIAIDLDAVSVPLRWEEIFGRRGEVHVDIGAGKGRFLLELAEARPGIDLLGVERAGTYYRLVCERAARRGLANVRMLHTTAEDLLFRLLPDASVDVLYVLFPDPWPKKRHHKRRLFKPEHVARMAEVLVPGGRLLVKTDHPGYGEVIEEVLRGTPGLEAVDPEAAFAGLPETGFERKYREAGRPIRAWALERR